MNGDDWVCLRHKLLMLDAKPSITGWRHVVQWRLHNVDDDGGCVCASPCRMRIAFQVQGINILTTNYIAFTCRDLFVGRVESGTRRSVAHTRKRVERRREREKKFDRKNFRSENQWKNISRWTVATLRWCNGPHKVGEPSIGACSRFYGSSMMANSWMGFCITNFKRLRS